jgi:hypothetical protein
VEEHARLSAPGQPLELGVVTFLRGRSLLPWKVDDPGAPRDKDHSGYLRAPPRCPRCARRSRRAAPAGA